MLLKCKKYGIPNRPAFLLVFLFINTIIYPQEPTVRDSVYLMHPFVIINLPATNSFFTRKTLRELPDSIIPSGIHISNRNNLFYDSLQTRASRYLITRKLYDILVVNNNTSPQNKVSESSQSAFSSFSGKKIRKISIQRLEVFGTNINNPLTANPKKIEAFLNKTHLNTNELIIRNNLLFSAGDTVSPLILSDNERILRELPFIDESRIIVIPVSDEIVDILILTKDVYSAGVNFDYKSIERGSISIFDKNIFGLGHEFRLTLPYDSRLDDSPGIGIEYNVNNIRRSFINMNLFYYNGLGMKSYGFSLEKNLVSSTTKYAGGISVREMFTTEDLDTMTEAQPLKYNLQDYWFSRSFLLNKESVARLILGARYTFNNVFDRPFILPNSHYNLQKYRIFLGSVSFSMQKYYKTNLIYGYGRTEDIPYGGLITMTVGREINESNDRFYGGVYVSTGHTIRPLGFIYASAGISTFINNRETKQGMLLLRSTWFSNLLYLGSFRIRNFIMTDYTRGFDRNPDEFLSIKKENGFEGFSNDSVGGAQRLSIGLESVLFSPVNLYGFRFAFFAYGNLTWLFGTNQYISQGEVLSSVGIGVRIRNDNLVFNTFQIRLSFYPNMPAYSSANLLNVSGEQLLRPDNFDPGKPNTLPYR
jgi:hypothetical protein